MAEKKSKNQLQHASQVRTILEELDPLGKDIRVLSEDEGYIVWTEFVDLKMEVLKGGTIRSYLGSYELFLTFVTAERVRGGQVPLLDEDTLRIFRNTLPRLKGWRKTVDLEKKPQRTEDILQECDTRLTTEDVKAFHNCSLVDKTKAIFQRAYEGDTLSVNELCHARDYLLAMITLRTGTRPGALANATLQHYNSMRTDDSGRYSMLLVPRHTRGVSGPAPLPFNKDLQQLLHTYVNNIGPQLGPSLSENLFLTCEGFPFEDRNISRQLPEFWRKSEVRADLRVTATNIRKWIVTVAHQKKAEGENLDTISLRQSMYHSSRAAEHFYLREDLTRTGAVAADIIDLCSGVDTRPKPATSPVANAQDRDATAEEDDTSFCETLTSLVATAHHREATEEKEGDPSFAKAAAPSVEEPQEHESIFEKDEQYLARPAPSLVATGKDEQSQATSESKTTRGVRPLSGKEKREISLHFKGLIQSESMVTLAQIRNNLKTHSLLKDLLEIPGMDKKVADSVRTGQIKETAVGKVETTRQERDNIQERETRQEKEDAFDFVDEEPASIEERPGRIIWSESDNAIIKARFLKDKKYPGIYKLVAIFHETSELKRIFNAYGKQRCVDKVKNVFKTAKK